MKASHVWSAQDHSVNIFHFLRSSFVALYSPFISRCFSNDYQVGARATPFCSSFRIVDVLLGERLAVLKTAFLLSAYSTPWMAKETCRR